MNDFVIVTDSSADLPETWSGRWAWRYCRSPSP